MKVHHIGLACQDIEQSIEDFKKYHNIIWKSDIVTDNLQNAKLCLVKTDLGLDFEFISGNQVARLLKKGISYYHICYEVESIDRTIEEYLAKGAIMVSEPKPAILFDNKRVSFLYLPYGLIELVEK
jgi:methylmalonyl-CoA/ethylmalonyl-CoA epimerase